MLNREKYLNLIKILYENVYNDRIFSKIDGIIF